MARVLISPMAKKAVKRRKSTVFTRNLQTMTEAEYWNLIRSALRRAIPRWEPAAEALRRVKRPANNPLRPRLKWEYQCAVCREWFAAHEVDVDHILPAGELNRPEDLAPFLERLYPENPDLYQVLCSAVCHRHKTNYELSMQRNGLTDQISNLLRR